MAAPDGKLPGEENEFAHTDLYDFYANVEGAEVAYLAVRDIALGKGADGEALVAELDAQFEAMKSLLSTYGDYDAGFVFYDTVTQDERNELGAQLNALSEPLSTLTLHRARRRSRPDERARAAAVIDPAGPVRPRRGCRRRPAARAAPGAIGAGDARDLAPQASGPAAAYPFYGDHQAGITTPVQDRLHFAAFDLTSTRPGPTSSSCSRTGALRPTRLTRGLDVTERGAVDGPALLPPDDTGEAQGLPPNGLTITIGFGPSLFDERFGLAESPPSGPRRAPAVRVRPARRRALRRRPLHPGLRERPQVAVHAIRNLSRMAFGTARIRWSQLGFGRTSSTSSAQATPRNLFGFKDGTANIKAEQRHRCRRVRLGRRDADQAWMAGGSYLVTRKILMTIESWDRVKLEEQEQIIGRDKGEGAPLSGGA